MRSRLVLSVLVVLAACARGEETPEHTSGVQVPAIPSAGSSVEAERDETRPVVVFVGTSLTAGLGLLRDEDTFVARLEELADSAGLPFRAVNAGVSGETSAGGLRRITWILRQSLDVLVLELGANDGLRGQDPAAMESNLREIIRETRTRYPATRVILAGMEAPPNLGEEYAGRFRRVFPTVAREEDALLIPFLLEGVAGFPEFNQSDGIHPNPEGHDRVARTVWPFLRPVLDDLSGNHDAGVPR